MEEFERKVRQKLKTIGADNKIYLKVKEYEVDYLFDMKKIIAMIAGC